MFKIKLIGIPANVTFKVTIRPDTQAHYRIKISFKNKLQKPLNFCLQKAGTPYTKVKKKLDNVFALKHLFKPNQNEILSLLFGKNHQHTYVFKRKPTYIVEPESMLLRYKTFFWLLLHKKPNQISYNVRVNSNDFIINCRLLVHEAFDLFIKQNVPLVIKYSITNALDTIRYKKKISSIKRNRYKLLYRENKTLSSS